MGIQGISSRRTVERAALRQALLGATAFAVTCGFTGTPVLAQDNATAAAERDDSDGVQTIIVTARRREESAQSTPVSVSAISGEQLETLNIQRIDGLTQLAPSLRVTQASGSGTAPAVYIRGIGTLSTALYVEPAVGVYVDGVYTPRPSGNTFDFPDIASVEVLRGPQGTLFGRNTTGGAIMLTTRNPTNDAGVKATFGYGSDNDMSSSAVVQFGQIAGTPFALKIAGQIRSRDGWVESPTVSDSKWGGALYNYGAGAALRGELGDGFSVDLRGRYNRVNTYTGWEALAGSTVGRTYFVNSGNTNGPVYPIGVGPRDYSYRDPRTDGLSQVKSYGGVLTVEKEFSDAFAIKSITGLNYIRQNLRGNLGGGATRGVVANPRVAGQPIEWVSAHTTTANPGRQSQFTQELQFLGEVGDFNYLLGAYYWDEKVNETITTIINSPISAAAAIRLDRSTNYVIPSKSYAGFGQIGWKPSFAGGRLEIVGGLRYTKDKKSLTSRSVSTTIATTTTTQNRRDSWDNIGWLGSLSYQVTPDILFYGRASSAYRSGGYNAPTVGAAPFDPETAKSYEVGFKSDLFDRHVRLNVSAFQTDYSDLQVNGYNIATNTNQLTNAGVARYRGFEVEGQVAFGGFRMDANLGHVDPEYKEYILAVGGVPTNVAGLAEFANVPHWTYHVGAQYAVPLSEALTMTLRGDYSGKSNAPTYTLISQAPNTAQVPLVGKENNVSARAIFNLVTRDSRKVTLQVFGENLTNNRYLTFASDFGAILSGTYNRPRSYGVSLGFDL